MRRYRLSSLRRALAANKGAVAIVTALALFFVIPGFAALAVDIGRYMSDRQQLQNALDAGALAGAQFLPHNEGGLAASMARAFVIKNLPDLYKNVPLDIRFGCLVNADPVVPTMAQQAQVTALCSQYAQLTATFTCPGNGRCYRPCAFINAGDGCNAISVRAKIAVPLMLARAIPGQNLVRIDADLVAHACRGSQGACGPPKDLNLVLLLDRSGTIGLAFDQVAEGAKAILRSPQLKREFHQVALGVIPACAPGEFLTGCNPEEFFKRTLTPDYQVLEHMINYLEVGGGATDLAKPIAQATSLLLSTPSRHLDREVSNYIILLTDGAPNDLTTTSECDDAKTQADFAIKKDIQIYTIGYFPDGDPSTCFSPDFNGRNGAELLQKMTTVNDTLFQFSTCLNANQDGDHFYCELLGGDLQSVFDGIFAAILNDLGGSSLVDLSVYLLN